nr:hypothetical protein 2 [Pelagibacteraceae bacterium]
MNIKSTLAALTLAVTTLFASPVEASVENTAIRRGNVAGYNVVVTDTPYWDTIVVPYETTFPGIVLVNCSTGDFRFEGVSREGARQISIAYCH